MNHQDWVIAGPESCGKTTLWQALSSRLHLAHFVPEFNRIWLEENNIQPPYSEKQLTSLFAFCLNEYQDLPKQGMRIWDTDELNLILWCESVGHPMRTVWMKRFLENQHRYILCPPTIGWEYDPLRQGPESRDALWQGHLELLEHKKYYVLQSESLNDRIEEVLWIIAHP